MKNFHHLCIGIPLIPMEMAREHVGHRILEKPSPNWNARQVTCRLTPSRSPRGARIGITVAACPVEDGIKKLISVSAESAFPEPQ